MKGGRQADATHTGGHTREQETMPYSKMPWPQFLGLVCRKEWPWLSGFAIVGVGQAYLHLNLTGAHMPKPSAHKTRIATPRVRSRKPPSPPRFSTPTRTAEEQKKASKYLNPYQH